MTIKLGFVTCLFILLTNVFTLGQITNNPTLEKGPKPLVIESISIDNFSTSVRIKYTPGVFSTWIMFSSQMYIYDYYNPNVKFQITKFVGNNLDTKYYPPIGQYYHFELIFPKIPPGITKISIQEFTTNGFLWSGIKISNPDNTPTTSYSEQSLKEEWINNGIDDKEGIFEIIPIDGNLKYKVAVKKSLQNYKLIYLNGIENSTWKSGDVKGSLLETGNSNVYNGSWYFNNKELTENLLGSYENGVWKLLFPGNSIPQILLKTYPTISDSDFKTTKSVITTGTGFAISSNGFIVTNYHVIQDGVEISIRGLKGDYNSLHPAKVILTDKNNDLAVIQVEGNIDLGVIPFGFRKTSAEVGEGIFVLGFPLLSTMGDEIKLTNGIISAKTGFMGDVTAYQVSAPIQPGNSGGPLFDNQGNLIGIINAKHVGADNVSYGIKSNYLLNLIQSMDSPPSTEWKNVISQKSLPQQVQEIKKFVYIIEVK